MALKRSLSTPIVTAVTVKASPSFELDQQIYLEWFGADVDVDHLTYSVSYSIDQGKSFRPIQGGLKETRLILPTLGLGGSKSALFKVTASNGFNMAEAISNPFPLPKSAPVATIFSPTDNAVFTSNESIFLSGVAINLEEGMLGQQFLQWYLVKSQELHFLGSGREVSIHPLSVGKHLIRLVATDQEGAQAIDERTIVIQEAPLYEIVLPDSPKSLKFVEVSAPDINYIFARNGQIVASDSTAEISIEGAEGKGFLQSRMWSPGEEMTLGSGLTAYLYRIALNDLVGDPTIHGITSFSIKFGSVEPLNYDRNTSDMRYHGFVITRGGLGAVAPNKVEQAGDTITFHFNPQIGVGKTAGGGESSFFFGIASRYTPSDVVARIGDFQEREYNVNACAPSS
ncbi:hypothetical protein [Leptodesmis sichuanensis]|uniref:hypothetical protein n=1 Tax=Leptodesmis sichuanensis TaxID=2906798 RepID=UPI001F157F67|nr:hypothetical protein [Leptodesmis sichuanensis]UIE36661.1 hypothetical protein KIK02_16675 [Leptodesmis sichuanensis A121]